MLQPTLYMGVIPVFAVLIAVLLGLMLTRASPDMVLLGGLAILLATGNLSADRALEGFSNPGVATIAVLFVVAEGVRRSGGLQFIERNLLRPTPSLTKAQLMVMVPVAAISAVMNNSPVVAMVMPVMRNWAHRCQISESKLLLPLSYASILGGLLTLVGTSTTLIINGMLLATPGIDGLKMFEIFGVGFPIAVVGIGYVIFVSPWLLPQRKTVVSANRDTREYTIEMLVDSDSTLVGRSIREAGLRNLDNVYLLEIVRGKYVVPAVSAETRLAANDRLVFVGVVDSVIELKNVPGLTVASDHLFKLNGHKSGRCTVEVVVSNTAPFLGMSIREAQFRTRFHAGVIAVARHGQRIRKKIGDISLEAGDTLLLDTSPSFVDLYQSSRDFFIVREIEAFGASPGPKAWLGRIILLSMIALVVGGHMSMLQGGCLAGLAIVLSGCLPVGQVRNSVDWSVILGIGAGLGLGAAMQDAGAADLLGDLVVEFAGQNPMMNLGLVSLLTMLLANLITTKAAAILMYPVAYVVADSLGVSFKPFAVALIFAGASAFATPVGYQTNLMVYGPGGYRSIDFVRLGLPLSAIVLCLVIILVPRAFPFN